MYKIFKQSYKQENLLLPAGNVGKHAILTSSSESSSLAMAASGPEWRAVDINWKGIIDVK